jgi:uncharacterized membrane protein
LKVEFSSIAARRSAWSYAWPAVPLAVSAALAFAWILNTQLARLYGLTAPSWDLGQEQQLLWSLSSGHGWASSYESGENFLGIHLEPILLPIAGLERLWPTPVVPLAVAAAGLALTAPAAFLMLRALLPDRPGRTWLALAMAAPMPFWTATQEAASNQFHPETLALPLAMLAAWAGLAQRRVLFWTLLVLVLCCKEDQTYTAFVIGFLIWKAGAPDMKRHGRVAMAVAVIWLVLGVGVLQLVIRGVSYSPDTAYYWWVIQPGRNFFVEAITRADAWFMLASLLVGMLGLPLLAPRWLLLVVPALAANLLSSHDPQQRLHLHYVLLIMFPLMVAAGFGGKRLLERPGFATRLRSPLVLAGAAPALILGFTAGRLPPALGADQWLYTQPSVASTLLRAAKDIPPEAPVYADDGAAVWLTNRTLVQTIPPELAPDRYVVIDRRDWLHRGLFATDEIARAAASGRRLLFDDGRFSVWGPASQAQVDHHVSSLIDER